MATYRPGTNPFSSGDDFPSTDGAVTLPGGVSAVFCDYPHKAEAEFDNLISTSWAGKEKRSSKAPVRLRFSLAFEQLTDTDADTLWNHFLAQSGDLQSFTYYDYQSGESFTVRYDMKKIERETFIFEAERTGIQLIEVL